MTNLTAPYLAIVVMYYLVLGIANAVMAANKLGSIDMPIVWWWWIAGFVGYLLIEHMNQYLIGLYQNK